MNVKPSDTNAQWFLTEGLASSLPQAEQMADIVNSPDLEPNTQDVLLWLAVRKGADFDVVSLSTDEIVEACDQVRTLRLLEIPYHLRLDRRRYDKPRGAFARWG